MEKVLESADEKITEKKWLEASEKARDAWWEARKSGDYTEYERLKEISWDMFQIWAKYLREERV